MKQFQMPEIEINPFLIEDVITTSEFIPDGSEFDDSNVGPFN